ncbi:MAG: hypothetical protein DPW16_11890 [Chloroflexi bacterium]|nr:hypothetical protein [Chloroflexota bacterium]
MIGWIYTILNPSLRNNFSHNTLILFANNGLTALLAFSLTVLIARGLGDAALGRYAAIMAWVLPLSLLTEFGIGTLITRNVARQRDEAQHYLSMTHPLRWMIGGGVIVAVWIFAPLLSDDAQIIAGLRIGIFLALIDALFASYTAVFRAWEMMWPILILNTGYLALQVVGAVVVVLMDGSVVGLLAVIVAADGVQLAATWGLWKKINLTPQPPLQRGEGERQAQDINMGNLLKQAWPFMVAGVLATLQLRMVILILQGQVGNEAVGWYAAANRVVEAGRMLPNAAFGALFPMLVALVDNPPKMRRVFRQAALFLVVYGVGVGGMAFIAGRPFVRFVFGEHFEQAGAALVILAWAILPGGLRGLITLRLYAYHREWWVNAITGVALIIQLIVGVWLIGEYGLTGAAWTIVLAEIVLAGLLFGTAWRSGDTMLRGH